MGLLFDTLILNSDLNFSRFGSTHVYWSAHMLPCDPDDEYPPQDGSYHEPVKKGFSKAIRKADIVISTRRVFQCSRPEEIVLTEEEELRAEIIGCLDEN